MVRRSTPILVFKVAGTEVVQFTGGGIGGRIVRIRQAVEMSLNGTGFVGDRLFARGTDQAKFGLFAESDHVFNARSVNARITFEHEVDGKPRALIVHRNGRDERGERLGASEETVVVLLNDEQTPMAFVVWLLECVFGKTHEEAIDIMLATHRDGRGICGTILGAACRVGPDRNHRPIWRRLSYWRERRSGRHPRLRH